MWRRLGVMVFAILVGEAAAAADKPAGQPLDKPAFTATPNELLAVVKAAPEGDWPVLVLREQRDISFDDAGRATSRARVVFVVRTQEGVDEEGTIYATWNPSYQDKPAIRARVIEPSGSVTSLDPALITEMPANAPSPAPINAPRHLEARLPRLQVGFVVEQEIVSTDREPWFAVGSVDVERFDGNGPAVSTIISFSVPAARKVHHVERKLPASVHASHRIANGRETWVYEVAGPPAATHSIPEFSVPSDVIQQPYVGVGTAPSWAAVALGYRKLVDQRIAEGPFELPAELPHTPSIETVNAITAWLHHQVSDTDFEGYESLAAPSPPAETAKRGRGDSQDRAALLVALLRQAGVRADLALLATGPGPELDLELPGMGAFNHAIVRVLVGGRELWIDAAEELMRPGQLPSHDQGRRALVIADDTKDLVTTPQAQPTDNVVHEVRTFVAAEAGASQLTEVTQETGVFEAGQRGWHHRASTTGLRKQLGDYAEEEYGGTLDQITSAGAADLATPFAVTIAVKGAVRVFTHREHIEVALYPSATLTKLPWIITNKGKVPRTSDFLWQPPHVYEIENRIVVPSGFTLPPPAPDRTRSIGTAHFTEQQRIAGQTLIVTFRFDTGKPRLTAAELTKLQDAIHDLRDEVVHLTIDHTGFALGYAGKPREAVAEIERLIALHPTEALHHGQLAAVLLRTGAGEAARREARKAVALAPADADALVVLGWTLTFDTLGRHYGWDWDRAGALAALQAARKLNPKHIGAATHVTDVASRNSRGHLYDDGADLRLALGAARDALALEKTDEHALSVVKLLIALGEYDEAETVARTMSSETRDPWIVAATAASRGAAAAIQTAGSLRTGSARAKLIDEAAPILVMVRQYALASALYAETGTAAHRGDSQATVLAKVTRHDAIKPNSKDPRDAVLEAAIIATAPDHVAHVFWNEDIEKRYRSKVARELPDSLRDRATPTNVLSDFLQSTIQLSVDGDGDAWRVEGMVGPGTSRFVTYVALDHGIAKVFGGPDLPGGIGTYVLHLLDRKHDDAARRLLTWFAKDVVGQPGIGQGFSHVWGPGIPTDRDQIALAAATLVVDTAPERVIAITTRCNSTIADVERLCKRLLLSAYAFTHRWVDLENQFEIIAKDDSMATNWARTWHLQALINLGRFDEADRVLDEALAKDPDDRDALAYRIIVTLKRGQPGEAVKRSDAFANRAGATPSDLNQAAWLRLTEGLDLDVALDLAKRAVEHANNNYAALNTLAAIEAERGDLGLAVQDGWKSMASGPSMLPREADWYVMGRIFEQLGLNDDAVAAYKRVTPRDDPWGSVYDLATKRLGVLRAAR